MVALLSMAVEGWRWAYLSLSGLFLVQSPIVSCHEPRDQAEAEAVKNS